MLPSVIFLAKTSLPRLTTISTMALPEMPSALPLCFVPSLLQANRDIVSHSIKVVVSGHEVFSAGLR
jgi:hypothetical protein